MGKELHFKRNNAVYIRIFVLSIIGSATMVLYYMLEMGTASFLWLMILSFLTVLFLMMLFFSSKKLIKRSPAFSLTDNGLVDDISLAQIGIIPWKNIKSVKYEDYLNQKHIMIEVKDSPKIIESLPFFKRKMVNQQFIDTGAVIVVSQKMIKGKPEELVTKIKRRARV
ncbi:hypothetical protein N9B82_03415 [Saprospiraceae bacterium]|nr:hypothetical protein [Saprospiraceae bacterium]